MWRLLGKSAHLWPEWFYKLISKIHSKIIRFNHSFLGEKIIGDYGTLDTKNNSYKIKSNNDTKVKVVIQNNE